MFLTDHAGLSLVMITEIFAAQAFTSPELEMGNVPFSIVLATEAGSAEPYQVTFDVKPTAAGAWLPLANTKLPTKLFDQSSTPTPIAVRGDMMLDAAGSVTPAALTVALFEVLIPLSVQMQNHSLRLSVTNLGINTKRVALFRAAGHPSSRYRA